MTKKHQKQLEKIYKLLRDIDNDDETIENLQKGAEYWCSNYDLCEGYKHAIRLCLDDQYNNHPNEQDINQLLELESILTKKTL
jgi:hypothetical protein